MNLLLALYTNMFRYAGAKLDIRLNINQELTNALFVDDTLKAKLQRGVLVCT